MPQIHSTCPLNSLQATLSIRANGKSRFNALADLRRQHRQTTPIRTVASRFVTNQLNRVVARLRCQIVRRTNPLCPASQKLQTGQIDHCLRFSVKLKERHLQRRGLCRKPRTIHPEAQPPVCCFSTGRLQFLRSVEDAWPQWLTKARTRDRRQISKRRTG